MRILRRLHRWLGLLVFIQILLWLASGFFISLLDMDSTTGRSLQAARAPTVLSATSIRDVKGLAMERAGVQSIRLAVVDGAPAYRVQYPDDVLLLDAATGEPRFIDAPGAKRIAGRSYAGSGGVAAVELIDRPSELAGFSGAAWRVQFADDLATRVYVDAADGRMLAHRNRRSALLEFLLKLHFMDYDGGHDFNHPLVIGAAFLALWLAVTGSLLLVGSLRQAGLR